MLRFSDSADVRVIDPDPEHLSLLGRTGKVVRKLIRDDSAWVRMDDEIPEDLARFHKGDARHNDVNLWPDECEPTATTKMRKE